MSGQRAFVIAGTDTGIGKTVFAAALANALAADYWKPIQAGLDEPTDSDVVASLGRLSPGRVHAEAYRLQTPASPHLAAELDGVEIDVARLCLPAHDRPLVVELAGGLLVPLTRTVLQVDVVAGWRLPVILVARTSLGTINHTLLSLEALRSRDVSVAGVAFVGDQIIDTEETICAIGGVRRLGRLPVVEQLTSASLAQAFTAHYDLEDFR